MTIQHILVPVDFSEHSDHILEYAIELAGKLQARITLLHVVQMLWKLLRSYSSAQRAEVASSGQAQ